MINQTRNILLNDSYLNYVNGGDLCLVSCIFTGNFQNENNRNHFWFYTLISKNQPPSVRQQVLEFHSRVQESFRNMGSLATGVFFSVSENFRTQAEYNEVLDMILPWNQEF